MPGIRELESVPLGSKAKRKFVVAESGVEAEYIQMRQRASFLLYSNVTKVLCALLMEKKKQKFPIAVTFMC